MLNPQEGGRLDAKALDDIWPVGMPVQCCAEARRRRASAQHCTGMTNWPNTIQCHGSDDIMSLGIKSSAFLRVEHPVARKFEVQVSSF